MVGYCQQLGLILVLNLVTNYGAVPGTDCTAALQRACDDVRARGVPDTIYIPGAYQHYYVSAPILCDTDGLSLRGDGRNHSVLEARHSGDLGAGETNILQFGVDRAPGGAAIPAGSWQSATGILDASVGQRYGLRNFGNTWLAFNASPFAFGPLQGIGNPLPMWGGTQKLTLDFCFQCNDAGGWQAVQYPLFGLSEFGNPTPFYCMYDGIAADLGGSVGIRFFFVTSDGVTREARVLLPSAPAPLLRCSIQLDLTHATITAWVNRTQVAVNLAAIGTGWTGSLSLGSNTNSPFLVGGVSNNTLQPFNFIGATGHDLTLFGLKFSQMLLYSTSGTAQARIDGSTLNDSLQFLNSEGANTIACLPLTDAGNAYRRVPYTGGWGGGQGLWITNNDAATVHYNNSVRDLGFVSSNGSYGHGQCISYGGVIHFTVQDCFFQGGAHGIGSLNFVGQFPLFYSNLDFGGQADAPIYCYDDTVYASKLKINSPNNAAIRQKGSTGRWQDVFVTPNYIGLAAFLWQGSEGGPSQAILENWFVDAEAGGVTYPSLGYIYAQSSGTTLLSVKNFIAGQVPASNDIVRLEKNPKYGPAQPPFADLSNISCSSSTGRSVVSVDGPTWKGTLKGLYPSKFPAVFNTGTGAAGIVAG